MLKANGLLNTEDREEEIKQMEVYKNHSKFMKTKVDTVRTDACVSRKTVKRWLKSKADCVVRGTGMRSQREY